MIDYLAFLTLTYLVSAIPVGYCIACLAGVDIRSIGSGNIGATNITRVIGLRLGVIVFALDASKSLLFVGIAKLYYIELCVAIVGMVVVYAQVFSVYLAFKGGKGVATMFGFYLAYHYVIFLIIGIVWLYFYMILRKPFLSSLTACAIGVLISSMLFEGFIMVPIWLFTVLIFYKHWHNIMLGR